MVKEVEGGIVIGLVAETPTEDKKEEATAPKKRGKKSADGDK
jgi:hypothetical protein